MAGHLTSRFLYVFFSWNPNSILLFLDYVARPDRISGADINAICQEAGMQAVRENRYIVLPKDFEKGYKNNIKKDETEHEFYK